MAAVKHKHTNSIHLEEGAAGWKGLEFLAKPYEFNAKSHTESTTERVFRWYKTYRQNVQLLSKHIE